MIRRKAKRLLSAPVNSIYTGPISASRAAGTGGISIITTQARAAAGSAENTCSPVRQHGSAPRREQTRAADQDRGVRLLRPVGFQNAAGPSDLRVHAAGSYSLISLPRTGRRRILSWLGSGTGEFGRGGRRCRAQCGRRVL